MRRSALGGALVALLLVVTSGAMVVSGRLGASPASAQGSNVSLVLYNAQHVPLAEAWSSEFTKQTGIKVEVRSGRDLELANQIVQEGGSSPADVFITENSPAMSMVGSAGLFAPVDQQTRDQVPARWSSPAGDWVGIAARTTVFVYNPTMVSGDALPKSIMDLA
jgi:iron(III) transport system substrate-binding protein